MGYEILEIKKREIICIVEESDRPVKETLDTIQVPRSSFYAYIAFLRRQI